MESKNGLGMSRCFRNVLIGLKMSFGESALCLMNNVDVDNDDSENGYETHHTICHLEA